VCACMHVRVRVCFLNMHCVPYQVCPFLWWVGTHDFVGLKMKCVGIDMGVGLDAKERVVYAYIGTHASLFALQPPT